MLGAQSSGKGPHGRCPHLSSALLGVGGFDYSCVYDLLKDRVRVAWLDVPPSFPFPGETRVLGGPSPKSGVCWNLRAGPGLASLDLPQASSLSQINLEMEGGAHIGHCARESLRKAIGGQTLAGSFFTDSGGCVPMQPKAGGR